MQIPDNDYINVSEALERLRGNRTILKKMLGLLPQNLPVEQLQSELEKGDIEALTHTVHSVKGVAANLSLNLAHRQAAEAEGLLRQGRLPKSELDALVQTLQDTMHCARQVAVEL